MERDYTSFQMYWDYSTRHESCRPSQAISKDSPNNWSQASKKCAKGISPRSFSCACVCVCVISIHFKPSWHIKHIAAKSHSSCRSHHTRRPFVKAQELGSKLKFRWPKIKQAQKKSSRYHHSHSDWPSVGYPQIVSQTHKFCKMQLVLERATSGFTLPEESGSQDQWYLLEIPKRALSQNLGYANLWRFWSEKDRKLTVSFSPWHFEVANFESDKPIWDQFV